MDTTAKATNRGWRRIERYAYVERPFEEVWSWLAGHLSTLGDPLPGGGRSVELHIRPGGVEVSRSVRLHVGGLVCTGEKARAALGWADATHPRAFPELEAVIEVAPVPHDGAPFTQLGVLARYRPPLGPLGAVGDRLVGAGVVDTSLTTFLDELANAVARHLTAPSLPSHPEEHRGDPDSSGIRRVILTVDGMTVRPRGAVGVWELLTALPGVVRVSLNPWSGLAAVDHDPELCGLDRMVAALEEPVSDRPAR